MLFDEWLEVESSFGELGDTDSVGAKLQRNLRGSKLKQRAVQLGMLIN